MKYFKPKSVTWWSGIGLLITGIATSIIEKKLDMVTITQGLGLIGVRAAIRD